MKKLLVLIIVLFAATVNAAPYAESQYTSLHSKPTVYTYLGKNGVVQTQTRVGFRYQNDLTDSIVVCQKEGDSACVESARTRRRTLAFNAENELPAFKIFIPPGTSNVSVQIYVGQGPDVKYFAVARLGVPLSTDSRYLPSTTEFNKLPSLGFKLSELRTKDCIGKHSSGILTLVDDSGAGIVTESDGAWLYVIFRTLSGNVYTNNCSVDVNVGTLADWHKQKTLNNTWNTLNEQSYINTPTEPWVPSVVPTPYPTTVPIESVGCDMYSCPDGRCVNGACVPFNTPPPGPVITCDAFMCYLSGGSCVGGQCIIKNVNPTPVPTPTPWPKKILRMEILNTPITIDMQPLAIDAGIADVNVGGIIYNGIYYQER